MKISMEPSSMDLHASNPHASTQSSAKHSAPLLRGSGFQQLREAVSEANPRKRCFPYDSTAAPTLASNQSEIGQHDHEYSKEHGSNSASKRNRTTDWPLKSATESTLNGQSSPPASKGRATLAREKAGRKKIKNRLSKFQEGSLNDKPSKEPPHVYLGAEDAMEQYHADRSADKAKDDAVYDPGSEATRPLSASRFGRFGKAVASVFTGFWKEKEAPMSTAKDTSLDDRKARIDEAYALLKLNNLKEVRPSVPPREREESTVDYIDSKNSPEKSFRDSAIEMDESQRTSLQSVRTQRPSEMRQAPPNTGSKRSASPAFVIPSGKRSSSLHLRTPSFQSLKKVKSQIYLPSAARPTDLASPLLSNHSPSKDEFSARHIRRQPSKKDLAKHQRLSKKVSDLESKLDVARRELEKNLQETPPVPTLPAHLSRKTFTPGALATLPSERFLTPHASDTQITRTYSEKFGSAPDLFASEVLSSPSRQLDHELNKSVEEELAGNEKVHERLMSSDPITRPDIDGVDYASWTTAQVAKNRRRQARHSSWQQMSTHDKVTIGNEKRHTSISTVSKGPADSPVTEEVVPPIPTISITASEVNKPRATSANLGRPGTASPASAHSKTKKRGISPPPPSLSSASKKKPHRTSLDNNQDPALTPDSTAGNRQKKRVSKSSPAPKAVQIKAARAKAVKVKAAHAHGIEKPLPEIQDRDESFKWDEDVF